MNTDQGDLAREHEHDPCVFDAPILRRVLDTEYPYLLLKTTETLTWRNVGGVFDGPFIEVPERHDFSVIEASKGQIKRGRKSRSRATQNRGD